MPPLVSVIIPCYGQSGYIAETIASVLAQTYRDHEIIVINDGSPDTAELERVLAPFRDAITYITQENRGLSGARNTGLAHATGEFVVCLDADDRLLPGALAAGIAAHGAQPGCAFVWGFHRLIDADGHPIPHRPSVLEQNAEYFELLQANIVGPPVGVMFRRASLVGIGGFTTLTHAAADYDAFLELARSHRFHCHRTLIAEYRQHGANMSADTAGMLRSILQALDRQARCVRDDPRLHRAWRLGRANARKAYDWDPRMRRLRHDLAAWHWGAASAASAALMARYPMQFIRLLAGRVWRSVAGRRR